MFENNLLLVLEEDLAERFAFLEKQLGIKKCVLPLKTILIRSRALTLIKRVRYREAIVKSYQAIKPHVADSPRIFLSNAEGFIAKNILHMIRRDFPEKQLVVLQHGIFVAEGPGRLRASLLKLANEAGRVIFGLYLAGEGFGGTALDKYIVYNNYYRDFLVGQGWRPEDVIVSAYYLKGFTGVATQRQSPSTPRTATFLLQCLYELGISSRSHQSVLIERIIHLLSNEFDAVHIKQHPYCHIDLPGLPHNCHIVNKGVDELVASSSMIVSFFSTALIDFEYTDIPTVAIKSKRLKVNHRVYDLFRYVHDFDASSDEIAFVYKKNYRRADGEYFYQAGISSPALLSRCLNSRAALAGSAPA